MLHISKNKLTPINDTFLPSYLSITAIFKPIIDKKPPILFEGFNHLVN